MRKPLLLAAALTGLTAMAWVGQTRPADAGWGPPFACGAGQKTGDIHWNPGIETPGTPDAAVTGVAAPKVETEKEWTVDELKAGKPTFLYYFVEGMDASNGSNDPSFKFSQSFEFGGLGEKVVTEINDNWNAKKIGLDMDADRKEAKNQARIEFWSYTGVKMGDITVKESAQLNPGPLRNKLKQLRAKNLELAKAEIKRIEERQKAIEKAEAAENETAAK